ncbi:MAG: response regulator [Cyanobacteria bacterium P01_A01_bin.123]
MRILLIDDDEVLMEILAESLIRQRYAVDIAVDGETAQDFLALFAYDLIVLDMLLPDIDGISLCQQFRQQGIDIPILMLTAKDSSTDKVQALDAGADDYVVKPFDFDELCARVRALLRRDSHVSTTVLSWGDLSLQPDTFEVFYAEHQLHTTPKEYALLELFLRHTNRVFSLDAIIENLWSFEDPPSGDAVRTHIKGLRQKLKAGGAPKDLIETVYGLGYRLKPLDPASTPAQSLPASGLKQPTKSDIDAAVAKVWAENQDTMQARLNLLEATAAALGGGQLSAELQHTGRSQAHKLAGSLGCFGFSEGSRLARELEHLLRLDAPLDDQHVSRVSTLVESLRQNLASGAGNPAVSATTASAAQILVVGAAQSFNQKLAADSLAVGIRSMIAPNPSQAHAILQTQIPDGVLLWLDDDNLDASMALLEAIAQRSHHIPVLIVTDIRDFLQRLQMVQQGADRILPASMSPQQALEVVQQTLQATREAFKVLIVDDDNQVLKLLKTILSPWRFQLTTLDNPAQLWSTLETVQPHLLVLDVEMPEANGLELCQVLRADEKWRQLPVLFLTVHEDANTQQQAFNVGADDFISKSAMATELPTRILNRLQRSQL